MRVDHYELRQLPRQLMDGIACNVTQALRVLHSALCTLSSAAHHCPGSSYAAALMFMSRRSRGMNTEVRRRKEHGTCAIVNCDYYHGTRHTVETVRFRAQLQCNADMFPHCIPTERQSHTLTDPTFPVLTQPAIAQPGAARRVTRGGKRNVVFVVLALVAY